MKKAPGDVFPDACDECAGLQRRQNFADEAATVVAVRHARAAHQLIFANEAIDRLIVLVGAHVWRHVTSVTNPRPSHLVIHHRDAVVVVVGVWCAALDDDLKPSWTCVLGCAQCAEEVEIDQLVRELCTHRAPP